MIEGGGHHKLIVRGGHRMLIPFAQIHYIKGHKIWLTLFTHYPINQNLTTISLGLAVYSMCIVLGMYKFRGELFSQ